MEYPWNWLALAVMLSLFGLVLLLADNIMQHGRGLARKFWRSNIQDDYEFSETCFFCDLASCSGCRYENRGR